MFDTLNLKSIVAGLGLISLSLIAGLASVGYVSLVDGNLMLISAFPFILAMGMFLVFDKRNLFMLVMVMRASGDIIFESSKFGGGFGVGGLINALVIFIAMLFIMEKPERLNRHMISIWGAVLLIGLASVFHAPELRDAARLFLALCSYCAVFVIAFYVVRTKQDFEQCISVILLSSLLPVMYAFVDIAQNMGSTQHEEGFRLQSTFSHPNIFAFYLVLTVSLLFYRLKTGWQSAGAALRAIAYGYLLLLLGLLVLTQTRSAWAGCIVLFALYGVFYERRYLLYLLLAPVLALALPNIRDRLMDLGSGNEYVRYAKLNSFAWRVMLWESAMEWINPVKAVFGYGLNAFKHYSPTFFPLAGKTHFGAHSTYVQWFFETGVVGILAAIWMHIRLFIALQASFWKSKLYAVIAVALIIEYLFFAFSDNMLDYLAFNWYFWFFIGTAVALTLIESAQPDPATVSSDSSPIKPSSTGGNRHVAI